MLNYAPCHEDVWGSGVIKSRIFNLCAGLRRVVSFIPWPLYSLRNDLQYPLEVTRYERNIVFGTGAYVTSRNEETQRVCFTGQ